jgi:hypothetical protein
LPSKQSVVGFPRESVRSCFTASGFTSVSADA